MISPIEGTAGTAILVTGAGWLPNDRVTITMTPPSAQQMQQLRSPVRVRVGRNGSFRATITVPTDDRLLREPVVWVVATGSRGARAIAPFTMLPPVLGPVPVIPATPQPPSMGGTPSPGSDG
jgi:hypothetical protein